VTTVPLSLGVRLAANLAAAALLFLASPGVSGGDGSVLLAVAGVALWSWTVAHPLGPRPRRALLVDWLGGAVAGALYMWWVVHVVGFGVAYIGAGVGVYTLATGILIRRGLARLPFAWTVASVWTAVELVRALVPPPFGLGWFRLGFHAHAELWLSGSARVFGVEGLSFVLAAAGGGIAACALARRVPRGEALAALGPLALAFVLARLVPAPVLVDGPRVLLVQPGFEQAVKQHSNPRTNFTTSVDHTRRALSELGPVDLVCWGETMLYLPIFTPAAEAAVRAGTANLPPWEAPLDMETIDWWREREAAWVQGELFGADGGPGLSGASFSVGAEIYDLVEGQIRRRVGLLVYDAAGNRTAPAYKQFLVPLGETFFGFERHDWARELAFDSAGYVPDLVAGEHTGRLELRARDGRSYHLSGTVCFDNAHSFPYRSVLAEGPVDFHLVASNEAWYGTSCEMDQMVAFSRVFALATGRSFVRATNSGVSTVIGGDGREVGRVRDPSGVDRAVPGALALSVPVPAPGLGTVTPYVRLGRLGEFLWLLLGGLALVWPRRPGNHPGSAG
jgi:apolipoprotein N-acyltransferase